MGPVVFSFHLSNDSLKSLFKPGPCCTHPGIWVWKPLPSLGLRCREAESGRAGCLWGLEKGIIQKSVSSVASPGTWGRTVAGRMAESKSWANPQCLSLRVFYASSKQQPGKIPMAVSKRDPSVRLLVAKPSCKLFLLPLNSSLEPGLAASPPWEPSPESPRKVTRTGWVVFGNQGSLKFLWWQYQ